MDALIIKFVLILKISLKKAKHKIFKNDFMHDELI